MNQEVKCELYHDNFQNFKRYDIPKAQLRENTSSSCNMCECVACQNRSEAVTYIASNRTLTEADIRALEAMKK